MRGTDESLPATFTSSYSYFFNRIFLASCGFNAIQFFTANHEAIADAQLDPLVSFGTALVVSGALIAPAVYFLIRRFQIRVYPQGIKGYDSLGRDTYIDFSGVTAVTRLKPMLGLFQYARITTNRGKTLVFPTQGLSNMQEFKRVVLTYVGTDHLLGQFLQENV